MAFKATAAFIDIRKVFLLSQSEFDQMYEYIAKDQLQIKYGGSAPNINSFFPPVDTLGSQEKVTLKMLASEKRFAPFFNSTKKFLEFLELSGEPVPSGLVPLESDAYLKINQPSLSLPLPNSQDFAFQQSNSFSNGNSYNLFPNQNFIQWSPMVNNLLNCDSNSLIGFKFKNG
jgi:hypothetical protein